MSVPPPSYDKAQEASGAGGFQSPPAGNQGFNQGTNVIHTQRPPVLFGQDPVTTTCQNCQSNASHHEHKTPVISISYSLDHHLSWCGDRRYCLDNSWSSLLPRMLLLCSYSSLYGQHEGKISISIKFLKLMKTHFRMQLTNVQIAMLLLGDIKQSFRFSWIL